MGPPPFWLSDRWPTLMAALGAVTVTINGLAAGAQSQTVSSAVAWISCVCLYLSDQNSFVHQVARWRARVREEDEEDGGPCQSPDERP